MVAPIGHYLGWLNNGQTPNARETLSGIALKSNSALSNQKQSCGLKLIATNGLIARVPNTKRRETLENGYNSSIREGSKQILL
jgi:hypothetical protein